MSASTSPAAVSDASGIFAVWSARWRIWMARVDRQVSLTPRQQCWVFFIAALLLFSRLPSFFLHSQFYGEDGTVWYAQAYTFGWLRSLTLPDGGYLNTLQRLGTGVSMLVPFRWTPLVMALFGLCMQCVPVTVLLSSRCRLWGPLSTRCLFAVLYIAVPNSHEVLIVLTNCQWHLILVALLLAFGTPPRSATEKLLDILVFLVSGVSGPFCIVLFPVLVLFWYIRRQPWTLVQTACTFLCILVQTYFLNHHSNRTQGPLGANLHSLIQIFGNDVIASSVLGSRTFGSLGPLHHSPFWLALVASPIALAIYAYTLRYANLELKLFVLFSILLFTVSLLSPLAPANPTRWQSLILNRSGRYWFYPMMAFLWGSIWCFRSLNGSFIRRVAGSVLCLLPFGTLVDWCYKPFPDFHFAEFAERMKEAPPGAQVSTTVIPGDSPDWILTLTKK